MQPMLKIFDLLEILNISRATLWRLLNNDANFPKPVILLGCKRWRREDVEEYLNTRAGK
jgi:predicted DNA-binding transcriptional regulator AlpA